MGNQQQRVELEEDLSIDDYRYLMKQTRLSPHVIQAWYKEFISICPDGELNESQFIKFYKQLENSSTKNVEFIAKNVFHAFDYNGNNRIDFKEFLIAYALTSFGSPEEKLHYVFSLFDKNRNQAIELNEMIDLLQKLFAINGHRSQRNSPEIVATNIFRAFDIDQNQSLSKEEFINGCLKSVAIRRLLSPFENNYPAMSK